MRPVAVIAAHVLQESVRRRVFLVVFVLSILFVALFAFACEEAFHAVSTLSLGNRTGTLDARGLVSVTLDGLGMFATLFLGTVLAVFLTLGAVRGDAERGLLQPLVVRPLGRSELLVGRFTGAASVCTAYVIVLYAMVLLIVHATGHRWPDRIVGPGLALAAAVTILVALSLLGSVLLSATANGIALFMIFGAGLVAGLLATIGSGIGSTSLQTIAHDLSLALPFEALYQAGLHALAADQSGFTGWSISVRSAPHTPAGRRSTSGRWPTC